TGAELEARLETHRFKNIVVDETEAVKLAQLPNLGQNWFYSLLAVPLTLGGALIPGLFFRKQPVMAEFAQIKGKFPACLVAYPKNKTIKAFSRGQAIKLAAAGLYLWLKFVISSRRIYSELKALARTCLKDGEQ
ncbi:MAG: hypothetical protein LBT47_05195, partial [Deltaproteobacteria bacterium]|nr:hypothetical protein [Deltaproteobacteria bacterium]